MKLSVNIDHVATIREARGGVEPDPVHAAVMAEAAGADGIVCHLREDRRHINDRDVHALREIVTTKLDLEMAATTEIITIALDVEPDMVTLVPENRQELTTEGGLNVADNEAFFSDVVDMFHERGIAVSLFIEPDFNQIEATSRTGADLAELHTGTYSHAVDEGKIDAEIVRLRNAAEHAAEEGLVVKSGHGLTLRNLDPIVRIPHMEEVSIGHSLVSHAVMVGMDRAVRDFVDAISRSLATR